MRTVAVLAVVAAVLVVAASARLTLPATLALAAIWLTTRVVLPRAAHRAFRAGDYGRAGGLYAILAAIRLDPAARAAARVSRAACRVGREDWSGALDALAGQAAAGLPEPVRAAWLNNRAYAVVRSGGSPAEALALADGAVALRPDVPGFRHTRAIALLACGRVDEAIRELDEVWRRGDERAPQPLLEAERCYDLGLAWDRKGEAAHAADYFDRARRVAPGSPWAARAAARLAPGLRSTPALDDLL
jgi:predicted Zn-dependent protease